MQERRHRARVVPRTVFPISAQSHVQAREDNRTWPVGQRNAPILGIRICSTCLDFADDGVLARKMRLKRAKSGPHVTKELAFGRRVSRSGGGAQAGLGCYLRRMRTPQWLRTLGLVVAAFAGGAVTSQIVHARTGSTNPYDPLDQLSWVLVLIENQHVDPAERRKLVEGAIKGMVAELDAHSAYMDPKENALFQSDTEGKFGGIGVEVDVRDDRITVLAPMEGSPAARAGVLSGDEIVAVEGKPVRGERLDRIVTLMRGPLGTHVRLTIMRQGRTEPIELDLVREEIHVVSVVGKRLDNDVAYVRLRQFQADTHDELLKVTAKLRAESGKPLRGVLLDMRNNPGGLVDQAEGVADELLDGGTIYSMRHRGKVIDEVKATSGGALAQLPVVTLVNEYSASSAEIVAGALQDNRRSLIVGATTFGKGSIQTIFELPGGAGMRLTTMRYYTPTGRTIQAHGIRPDVVIEADPSKGPGFIVRESDLEGHLSAETGGGSAGSNVARAPSTSVVASANDTGVGREVPADPTKSTDFTLSEGYKLLLQRMGTTPTR